MRTIEEVTAYASGVLSRAAYERLLADNPADHAPKWHVFGLLGHIVNTIEAATQLEKRVSIDFDLVRLATLHDIGKVKQFLVAVRRVDAGEDPARAFMMHENRSADYAQKVLGLCDEEVAAIKWHELAYQARPEIVASKLVSEGAFRKWMLLCAADAVGKGWTVAQREQRPEIAERFDEAARLLGIMPEDRAIQVACEAVRTWQPVNPLRFA